MKKIVFSNIDEHLYKETLKNGVDVYLYPTNKTKNFYITISVKYGAGVKEYSIDGENKKITPGTAHFLEHKIMNFTNRKSALKIMNELGLFANAYTSYELTNYNIFGSKDPISSLKLLLDMLYNPIITATNVESEKGIISEEYKMYNDNPAFRISKQISKNILKNSFLNDILVGNLNEINSINKNNLLEIYKTFYNTYNTFITITGNFDLEKIVDFLNDYMKMIKPSKVKNIKIKHKKEIREVLVPYMEIDESITIPKVIYSLKINKKDLKIKNIILKRYYLNFIFSSLFSNTSDIYEKYKRNRLIEAMGTSITDTEENYLMSLTAVTEKPDELISKLKEDLKTPYINKETFERKKKMFVNNLVLGFENIEDVEFLITNNVVRVGRIINDSYNILYNMSYDEFLTMLKAIDFDNSSILKVMPKK